jgi:hypothetical protein
MDKNKTPTKPAVVISIWFSILELMASICGMRSHLQRK